MWKHVMFLCTNFIGVGMRVIAPLLLCLLSALVEVHSQTVPYLTIKGNNIPNPSYVDFNRVGPKLPNKKQNTLALHCNTDLSTCCTSDQGPDHGDWYFPNGSSLAFYDYITPQVVSEGRGSRQVVVYRIPTVSVYLVYIAVILRPLQSIIIVAMFLCLLDSIPAEVNDNLLKREL